MLGTVAFLALVAVAVGSGVAGWSAWWLLIPAFLGAALNIVNNPASYSMVMAANREGRLGAMPIAIVSRMAVLLVLAFAVRWISSFFA
ncbi:hypothetical protein EGM87_22690 [Sphingobium sp. RSMS]|uniref:hypothetical protein n=1 Tax=Sphingobium sp. RSMS TaxID=520734 RepID=UPI0010FA0211|nr:hypothetical protein [Sphingobium sp. RSMS]UXC93107.1 hypothetical protein EGM87_22690 [Sphingobium sp. RSMS]